MSAACRRLGRIAGFLRRFIAGRRGLLSPYKQGSPLCPHMRNVEENWLTCRRPVCQESCW